MLCGPETSYKTGAMDGQLWERPDVVYAVLRLAADLVYFCKGALEKWQPFGEKFAPNGIIASRNRYLFQFFRDG